MYNMYKLFFSIFTLSLFVCCNKKQEVAFLVDGSYEVCGTFLDKEQKKEYVFFAKKNFNPQVKIFDSQANLVDSLSLQKVEEAVGKITTIWMTSKDSVFVFSSFTQKYVVINRLGTVVKTKDLGSAISDDKNNVYEFYPPFKQPLDMRYSDDLIYTTFWIDNTEHSITNNKNYSLSSIMNNIRNGYLMFREHGHANIFGVQLSDFIELKDIKQSVFMPFHKTLVFDNRFFLLTYYSKYMYELNSDLDIIKRYKVVPNELSIVQPEPDTGDNTSLDKLEAQVETQSYVSNLLYIKDKNQFGIILKTDKSTQDVFCYPFRILVYNSNFDKLLNSYEFNSTDYIPGSSFILHNKIYVEKKSESYNNKIYEIIEIT